MRLGELSWNAISEDLCRKSLKLCYLLPNSVWEVTYVFNHVDVKHHLITLMKCNQEEIYDTGLNEAEEDEFAINE